MTTATPLVQHSPIVHVLSASQTAEANLARRVTSVALIAITTVAILATVPLPEAAFMAFVFSLFICAAQMLPSNEGIVDQRSDDQTSPIMEKVHRPLHIFHHTFAPRGAVGESKSLSSWNRGRISSGFEEPQVRSLPKRSEHLPPPLSGERGPCGTSASKLSAFDPSRDEARREAREDAFYHPSRPILPSPLFRANLHGHVGDSARASTSSDVEELKPSQPTPSPLSGSRGAVGSRR